MKRAIDIGPVDAAVTRTRGGKIRLRLHFSVDQIEGMLRAALESDDEDVVEANVEHVKRTVTQCNAPESEERRAEIHDDGDARARPPRVFVIEGTRAWDEWIAQKKRESGVTWDLTTTAMLNGRPRRGWYFPSLFPGKSGADPPDELSREDADALINS